MQKTISIRKGSFFERSRLELWQLLALTYLWSENCGRGPSVESLKHDLEIGGTHTIVDWNQFCRDACVAYFTNNPQQIGGPQSTVEIDESLFAWRKANVGRLVPEQWVFGRYDPQTKEGFLVPVPRRDATTLLPIVHQWVRPNSMIWSDMWRAYNQLDNQGFLHETVNHQLNFVEPGTGVCTNRVESMWTRIKAFKSMKGPSNRAMIQDYLAEFMWYQRFSVSPFYHFCYHIATDLYVVG